MGCRSDYMEPNSQEKALSQVACFLDELDGKKDPLQHLDGMHPSVYNKGLTEKQADKLVAKLCKRCQEVDVTKYSLELQIWWRDHQAADKRRVEEELAAKKDEAARKKALAKLTPHERKLLGY